MCRPTYFAVDYAINPWMDPTAPVDTPRAVAQWEALKQTYLDLGHTVAEIDPIPGLPDMVFAANGATVYDGRVYGAQFKFAERAAEAPAYLSWFASRGFETYPAKEVNEGEGDLLVVGETLLAGTGLRTDHAAHAEVQELFGLPTITLQLVDPRFYHLDTALTVLSGSNVAYYPAAFSEGSQSVLRRMFPDAVIASAEDAAMLGLNAVCDDKHVILPEQARGLAKQYVAGGFVPVPVDMSELLKAGGGPKCCTLQIG
jgi:N-dimethylarginine dimethylaminohydrolase